MNTKCNFLYRRISIVTLLCIASMYSGICPAAELPRKTVKQAINKPTGLQEFSSFIKDREYLDSPYEIASPESEQLLKFMERVLLTKETPANAEWQREWTNNFIAYLKEGNGEFLMISDGVYIVHSYFVNASLSGVWLADTKKSEFKNLASGYGIEIVDKGVLADGTGWILCKRGGLNRGLVESGYMLITYFEGDQGTRVQNTPLASEIMGYSEDTAPSGSYEYFCGTDEDRFVGIAGEVHDPVWKDINNDGQSELTIEVVERDCSKPSAKSIRTRRVFTIANGHAKVSTTKKKAIPNQKNAPDQKAVR